MGLGPNGGSGFKLISTIRLSVLVNGEPCLFFFESSRVCVKVILYLLYCLIL